MSRKINAEELNQEVIDQQLSDIKADETEKKLGINNAIGGTSVMAISEKTKIGVTRFLQIHPQDKQIANLMKKKYAMKVYTVSQWDEIVQDLLNKKTN